MLRIGISGVCGKMGQRIADLALRDPNMDITLALEKQGSPCKGKDLGEIVGLGDLGIEVTDDLAGFCKDIDCLIDFTLPGATLEHLALCRENEVPMVIGTTGFDASGEKKIKEAASYIPIVFSPNMAIGVNVVFEIVREAARVLGENFTIKIDETHHVHKKDSPSGTAKMLARVIKETSGKDVPIEAFREGEVIGNHGVIFDGEYESIEIRHNSKSRDVLAAGALEAAKFVYEKRPGLYNMADVFGLGKRRENK
ncbi:MAG: 4-hydroxy-tetrahydrodipicolinate reductase [Candidatus Omnitrophota bacterium]